MLQPHCFSLSPSCPSMSEVISFEVISRLPVVGFSAREEILEA
jgi:hypothetical protein